MFEIAFDFCAIDFGSHPELKTGDGFRQGRIKKAGATLKTGHPAGCKRELSEPPYCTVINPLLGPPGTAFPAFRLLPAVKTLPVELMPVVLL